jgi:hypothetical protein
MMEDPLFDPWGPPAEPHVPDVPAEATESPSSESEKVRRWAPVPGSGSVHAPRPAPRSRSVEPAKPARASEEAPTEPSRWGPLVDVVLPKLRKLAQRLELARHTAEVVDETAEAPSFVRLTVLPWAGPMPKSDEDIGSELEFLFLSLDMGVSVRTRMDHRVPDPDAERVLTMAELERRIDRILLDFVALALR